MSVEFLYIIGFLLVGGAIAFGIMRSSNRNKANDVVSETATRELYKDPDGYAEHTRDELKNQVKPS